MSSGYLWMTVDKDAAQINYHELKSRVKVQIYYM